MGQSHAAISVLVTVGLFIDLLSLSLVLFFILVYMHVNCVINFGCKDHRRLDPLGLTRLLFAWIAC